MRDFDILCATSCIMFTFMHICVRYYLALRDTFCVRHDFYLSVISLCHVVGSYYFASVFLLRCSMSHM